MGNEFDYVAPVYIQPAIIQIGSMIINQQRINSKFISIKLKRADYFPGEYIEGNVILQNQTNTILSEILLHLYLNEGWNVIDEFPLNEYSNKIVISIYLGIAKILKIKLAPNNNLINLNPGTFNFPFKFKLPANIQPTLEYPMNGQRGYIRYYLKAQIVSPYVKGENNLFVFIKTKFRLFKYPLTFTSAPKVKKLGMIDQGSTSLNVSYQNYNYQIGSQIPFEVEIDNSQGKSKVKSVDIKLIRRIQYIRQIDRRIMFNLENIINTKSFAVNVPSNTVSQKFNYVMEINDTTLNKFSYMGAINPYPKLGNLFYAMPSAYSNIIRCEYFLVVSLDFSGLVTKGYLPKVILPIVLNHDPGKEKVKEKNEGIEEDEDLKKAIEASLEDMKKVDDINIINIKDDKNENKENKEIKENEGEINILNEIKNEKENEIKINNINNINNENNSSEIIKEDNKNEIKEDIKINNINNINNEKPEDDKDINNPTLFSAQNNNKNLPNNFSINDFDEDNESNMSEANKKKKTFSLFD